MLNNELIDFLKKFDTPTISNALDIYRGSRSADGYTKYPFISANNKLEPIVGIARTAKIRASNPPILSPEETTSIRLKYYEYISDYTESIHLEKIYPRKGKRKYSQQEGIRMIATEEKKQARINEIIRNIVEGKLGEGKKKIWMRFN